MPWTSTKTPMKKGPNESKESLARFIAITIMQNFPSGYHYACDTPLHVSSYLSTNLFVLRSIALQQKKKG